MASRIRRRLVNEKFLANIGNLAMIGFLLTAVAAVVFSLLR